LKKPDLSIPPAAVSLRSRNGATCFFEGQKSMQKTLRLLMLLWKNYGGGKPAAIQTRPDRQSLVMGSDRIAAQAFPLFPRLVFLIKPSEAIFFAESTGLPGKI